MDDLSEYFSDKDEIARLNKQIDMMADFYSGFYKGEIKKLKSKLNVSRVMTCKHKDKNKFLSRLKLGTVKTLLRMNDKGLISVTPAEIAIESFVDVSIVSKAKKELGFR